MDRPIYFTIVDRLYNKYEQREIPVHFVAIKADFEQLKPRGYGLNYIIGRIENGCFIEDGKGDWWLQNRNCTYWQSIKYPEAGDKNIVVRIGARKTSWLYQYGDAIFGNFEVHVEDDNLLTNNGILVGSRYKEEEG